MNLSVLDGLRSELNVVILQTPSDKLRMFVEDKVKRLLGSKHETILTIDSKKDYKQVKEIMNIVPPLSTKWLVFADLRKVGMDKEFLRLVMDSTTVVFFCTSDRYSTYKRFKDSCKRMEGVYDFYLTSLRRDDLGYLYNAFVPSANRMSKALYDYVAQSYSNDIEALFELFAFLASGETVDSRADVAQICGIGGNSVESFVISLLKEPPQTVKGLKTVTKNRIKAGLELSEVYGWSTFYNYLKNAIVGFTDIKLLCISGVVYKHISMLPEGYDEKKLSRYQRYLWRIKEIPMSRIVRVRHMLESQKWDSELDFLRFIYAYMQDVERYEVANKLNI